MTHRAIWAMLLLTFSGCAAASRQEVVIYTAVDRKDAEPILAEFEQQTCLQVRAVYDAEAAKTTGLVARLVGESARPRCDVFWNNEIAQTLLLADRGLLAEYPSAAAKDIPAELKDPAGRWTTVATRSRVLVYNTKYVTADEAPRSLMELTQPRWRGKLAIANPQFGTTRTQVAAWYAGWGGERTQAFLRGLLDNQVRIVDGNAMVKNLVANARPDASPVYVGLTDTDDVLSGQAEGQPIELIYLDQDGDGTLVIPCTVSLIRGGPHPEAGGRLVDYLLGREVESRITAKGTGYTSARRPPPTGEGGVRAMPISYQEIFEQLVPSSEWTAEHFHP